MIKENLKTYFEQRNARLQFRRAWKKLGLPQRTIRWDASIVWLGSRNIVITYHIKFLRRFFVWPI